MTAGWAASRPPTGSSRCGQAGEKDGSRVRPMLLDAVLLRLLLMAPTTLLQVMYPYSSNRTARGVAQEWTATSDAAQRRLAQRAGHVAASVEALTAAGAAVQAGETGAGAAGAGSDGMAAPDGVSACLVAAGQVVAQQMAGLQRLMAAEATKHRAVFDGALKVRARVVPHHRAQTTKGSSA